jgi:hypothetical protein
LGHQVLSLRNCTKQDRSVRCCLYHALILSTNVVVQVNKVLLELIRSERVRVRTPYNCNSKVLHDVHSKFQNFWWVSFCFELFLHLLTLTSCMILLLWFSFGSIFSFSSKIRMDLLFV